MRIKEEIYKLCAAAFIQEELNRCHNNIKEVCSEGRVSGGSHFMGKYMWCCSLGNIEMTTSKNLAKNVKVSVGNGNRIYPIIEIYNLCLLKKQENKKIKKAR